MMAGAAYGKTGHGFDSRTLHVLTHEGTRTNA